MIVVFAGLPGSGKSTLARGLAERFSGILLNKDDLRAKIFPAEKIEYSRDQDDWVMDTIHRLVLFYKRRDPHLWIVLDGRTYSRSSQIEQLHRWARDWASPWRLIECTCSDAVAEQRIAADVASGAHPAKNRTVAMLRQVRQHAEPIADADIRIDTTLHTPEELLAGLVAQLTASGGATDQWNLGGAE
ncbi:AAA family ATPase [Tuwongella immobilis]|uniref:Uncharacterized protein n=1 Tax=Tuwongella immobilis TaxID=692036 RepID=A0A6C2YSG7_9BACT|nr:ATP-binding protein [Tuwongella immobilis]VIP04287.1 Uncharacterized protein OS=Thermobaculum terrenum (strain ATCC BAA-798 / YNP1) GN=Tter_2376 PE=4 SV=1: AAA_33 [Tuwongella immobilis]VTS05937.1 Uncharacterized protein OS=Thermobaculum terrenum (strain ATCC BAA-798 / YNP1) GN=Tter_2376 PE=4 SV=1: AAA_33 [Tuwongella immobilis]